MNINRSIRSLAALCVRGSPIVALSNVYAILRRPSQVHHLPVHIKVETTSRCNLACRFCGRTYAAWQGQDATGLSTEEVLAQTRQFGQDMDLATFEAIVEQFPNLLSIDLQGTGEPLLNPGFMGILEQCALRHLRMEFFTNATLLSREKAQAIVDSRVAQVSISVDGATTSTYENLRRGANFGRVGDNIAYLCEYRRKQGKSWPHLRLVLVVMRPNQEELERFVELGKELGVDEVVATHFKLPHESAARLAPEPTVLPISIEVAAHRARELGIRFTNEIELPTGQGNGDPGRVVPRSCERCLWPWLFTNITIEGYVTPCCYISNYADLCMGNVFEKGFAKLWNDEPYQDLRTALHTGQTAGLVCDQCQDHV